MKAKVKVKLERLEKLKQKDKPFSCSRLIVGLGNPGQPYVSTRHNAGFMLLDFLIEQGELLSERVVEHPLYTLYQLGDPFQSYLMKPLTFMNRSGLAVASFLETNPLPQENIAVVYDDLSLSHGRLKWRPSGSSGGQKGIANIMDVLGTTQITRLKLGIGSPPDDQSASEYVLAPFTEQEFKIFKKLMGKAADSLVCWAQHGISIAMSRFNGLNVHQIDLENREELSIE